MKRLLCWLFGHRASPDWSDNGCYTIHEVPEAPEDRGVHDHFISQTCPRCGNLATAWVTIRD